MNYALIEFAKAYQAQLLMQAANACSPRSLPVSRTIFRDRVLTHLGDALIDLGQYFKRQVDHEEFNPCVDCARC
jgi:hypothetical protein